jgi:GT2 family glycosyltransferase
MHSSFSDLTPKSVKLSIVILCWNDRKVISDCLRSIFTGTQNITFEVIVSDNGSTDGSPQFIREHFPTVQVIENGANLRFAKGNNVGIEVSSGEYVLILNPDTIIHEGSLDKWIEFADRHPEAGAFGCRVLNADGSYQESGRPFPTVRGDLLAALCLRPLAYISNRFDSDTYFGWKGDTERLIDWQCGCCVMFRGELLRRLGGFDEQFFYYYEEVDLCRRVWGTGSPIVYTPTVTITHLGGQSTKRAPKIFEVDKYKTRYRYFYKYYGKRGLRQCRAITLLSLRARQIGYGILQLLKPDEDRRRRLSLYRTAIEWNRNLDLDQALIGNGENLSLEMIETV